MPDTKKLSQKCLDDLAALRSEVARLRESENRHHQTEEALRKSEQRYRAVVSDQTELISRFLPDFTHTFANDAYCRYFDKTADELLGQSVLIFIEEEDKDLFLEQISKLSPQNPVMTPDHRVITKSGEVRWNHWCTRAIYNDSAKLVEYQSVGRDITERKLAEEALKDSEKLLHLQKKVLEQKNAALREILEQIEIEKQRIKNDVVSNVDNLLFPILQKLKAEISGIPKQYVELLESNLEELASSFGRKISQTTLRLTSREIEICNMVKNGLTSKDIARALNVSIHTINSHRNNIRRKVNINNEKVNLVAFLKSM
ncbi:MAG TPA: helix-turn-helix transcriptional regulator [Proteobacteria bacterium]|nr:helix-turn-helix transcriptional regulator [Pseudomonadota bacterium]